MDDEQTIELIITPPQRPGGTGPVQEANDEVQNIVDNVFY
jgi:hypothetical protein